MTAQRYYEQYLLYGDAWSCCSVSNLKCACDGSGDSCSRGCHPCANAIALLYLVVYLFCDQILWFCFLQLPVEYPLRPSLVRLAERGNPAAQEELGTISNEVRTALQDWPAEELVDCLARVGKLVQGPLASVAQYFRGSVIWIGQ